jgi:hypothetical protein
MLCCENHEFEGSLQKRKVYKAKFCNFWLFFLSRLCFFFWILISLLVSCQNYSKLLKITLVSVEITFETIVSVVITFMRVKVTMHVEITLCVWKLPSTVSISHLRVSYSHAYVPKLLSCVWKLHSACKITLCVKNLILCVEITVVSVVITFVSVKIRMRVEITLWLYKSHSWLSYSNA